MGLLKFNNQSFAIEQLPDGLVAVPESELNSLRGQVNAYLSLKSRLPVGVDETQIGLLIEKGQRFDNLTSDLDKGKAKIQELETKVKQYSNLPQDFSPEKWNTYVQQEQDANFAKQISALTKQVQEKVKKEMGVDIEVDNRFIDQAALEAFDPSAKDAFDQWYKIMDNAHSAQQEFLQKSMNAGVPPAGNVGEPNTVIVPPVQAKIGNPKGDSLGPAGPVVKGL